MKDWEDGLPPTDSFLGASSAENELRIHEMRARLGMLRTSRILLRYTEMIASSDEVKQRVLEGAGEKRGGETG